MAGTGAAAKRDRWASSSDEDEPKQPSTKRKTKKIIKTKKQPPSYNPLLQGCRFVYDTYEQINRVSEGAYGIVWKARDVQTGELCALKQIKFHNEEDQQSMMNPTNLWKNGFPVTALREISVLLALAHESIVSVKEMVVGDAMDKVFMVMEYFDCDLKDALSKSNGPLSQSNLKGILQQVLTGLKFVHSKRYMHRDMKPSNLLVQLKTGRIALADFGLARRYHDPATVALTIPVVTLWYRAPELLFGESKYGPAIDIWSMGCIFGELIQSGGNYSEDDDEGNAIMKGQGEMDQIDKIFTLLGGPTEENWPSFPTLPNSKILRWRSVEEPCFYKVFRNSIASAQASFLDANGLDLLRTMLSLDPNQRVTAEQALEHPYFREGVKPSIPHYFIASVAE